MRTDRPFLATQSDGSGQLFSNTIHLLLNPGSSFPITKSFSFGQIFTQVFQPVPVSRLGSRVEDWTRTQCVGTGELGGQCRLACRFDFHQDG